LRARRLKKDRAVRLQIRNDHAKVCKMWRFSTLRLTTDGRLLGFDTGDWSMLLGGFVLAGLLALLV
jgi:hypothetical protein